MAKGRKSRSKAAKKAAQKREGFTLRDILRWLGRGAAGIAGAFLFLVFFFAIVNPIFTPYMIAESWRKGGISRDWVDLEDMAPEVARSVVAAEDANFCLHYGFDFEAIRDAFSDDSRQRGGSTISQQVAKNVYLWHGRTWLRKGLEAGFAGLIELTWPKRRIVEVYLNVAEFDEGIFGAAAAARHYFGVTPDKVSATQAARLAAVLPSPKKSSAGKPSAYIRKRAAQISSGAGTIAADGRAECFTSG